MTDYAADNRTALTVTVPIGASVSTAIEFRGLRPLAIVTPAALTATTAIIQFWGNIDGATPVLMRDMGGTEIEAVCLATASWYIPLGNTDDAGAGSDRFRGVNTLQIRLFASDGSTAVAQAAAARTFKLICEEV